MKKTIGILITVLVLWALAVSALAAVAPPEFITNTLPEGVVDAPYSVKIETTDPNATFDLYNNEKESDFNKTGLVLTLHGQIEGTPVKAGIYTFTVSATGEGGKRYMTYTLTIKDAPATTAATTLPEETTAAPATTAPAENTVPATKPADPDAGNRTDVLPWWGIALIGVGVAATVAIVVVLAVTKKK